NLSTQTGARATTTAALARCAASASALPPVTHPPQVNPTIMANTAPPAIPQTTGFVSTGIFIARPLNERGKKGRRNPPMRDGSVPDKTANPMVLGAVQAMSDLYV